MAVRIYPTVSNDNFFSILLRCQRSLDESFGLDDASRGEGLAWDKPPVEFAFRAASIPGIDVIAQKKND